MRRSGKAVLLPSCSKDSKISVIDELISGTLVSRLINRFKRLRGPGRAGVSPLHYKRGYFGNLRAKVGVVEDTLEYLPWESSTRAEKGCRCKAVPISLPALGLGLFVPVIFETVH